MKNRLLIILPFIAIISFSVYAFVLKPNSQNEYIKTELYFGLSKPDGSTISNAEWQAFADTVITANLVNGSTIIDAHGQWLEGGKIKNEDSKVLVVVYRKTESGLNEALEVVRTKYIKYYKQESVLRLDEAVKAEF